MDLISIIMIAVGLAMDAFAVSVANGIFIKKLIGKNMLKFGLFFGLAQGIMPVIGYYFAANFLSSIMGFANFIAFAMLCLIGGKMIFEAFKAESSDAEKSGDVSYKTLLILSIATSIDAMVIGISFALLGMEIVTPAIIIGVVSFLLSATGVYIGNKLGGAMKKTAEIFGGCVLIFIGIKTLVGYLFFS